MIDKLFMFSDNQSSLGSTTASDYYADMTGGTQGKDAFGNSINIPVASGKLFLNVLVNTAVASAALTVDLVTSADATMNSSDARIAALTIPSGAAAGELFSVGVDAQSATWQRYVGVVYDTASGGVSASTAVDCWLSASPVTTHKLPY